MVPENEAEEVSHALEEPLPDCDKEGHVVALKLPEELTLAEPVLLLLCVSEAVAQEVLLGQRLCDKDTVELPDKPLAENDAEGVTLVEKDPEPVFVTVPQPLFVNELLPDCDTVGHADALKLP